MDQRWEKLNDVLTVANRHIEIQDIPKYYSIGGR